MNLDDKIKKLNVLKKLLNQDFISVKLGLGEEEVVQEVNDEIKAFLLRDMEATFAGTTVDVRFSAQEITVLKDFVRKIVEKVTNPPANTLEANATGNAEFTNIPLVPPKDSVRRQNSPVLDALRAAGFNPDATIEEKKAVLKNLKKPQ